MDCASFSAHSPNEHIRKENADELLRLWQRFAATTRLEFRCAQTFSKRSSVCADLSYLRSWLSNLDDIFRKNGLDVVDSSRLPISKDLRKASTDNFVVALEAIGAIAPGKDSNLLGTHEEFRRLFRKAVLETQEGVTISMDMTVAVGRKAVA